MRAPVPVDGVADDVVDVEMVDSGRAAAAGDGATTMVNSTYDDGTRPSL